MNHSYGHHMIDSEVNVNTPITDNAPGDSYSVLKTILLFVTGFDKTWLPHTKTEIHFIA